MTTSYAVELPDTAKPPISGNGRLVKVAYIMSRFPKISETFILYEILEQERLGLTVEVYPLLREHQPVAHPEAEMMVKRAHFHPFISWPIIRANWHFLLRRPGVYLRMIAEVLGGTLGSLNFFFGALGILPKAVRFAYEMEKQGISHVHAHFCSHPAVAALIIHRLTGIQFSFTAHGSDLHKDRRMLDKKVQAAAAVVTVSSFNQEVIVKACGEGARDKIHIIHCGIDPEVFAPIANKKAAGPFRIVCIGSFEEVKGHKYLVEACQILQQKGINFVCDLVGDGPTREQIAKQIAHAGLKDKVIIHGSLKRLEVAKIMRAADVKVLASVPTADGKREGMPVVLMEAMACGLPVVSSQLSGIPELVENGHTGILVPPADFNALAVALQKLRDDPDLRLQMGHAGREKVLREFNLRLNAAKLANLFAADQSWQKEKTPAANAVNWSQ